VTHQAAASCAIRSVLAGPARPAQWLGAARGALWLKTLSRPGAVAVLAHDATRLPCGLLLATTSAELPLTSLAPPGSAGFLVGNDAVSWTSPAGRVVVRAVREWAPARPHRGEVSASALLRMHQALADADLGIDARLPPALGAAAGDYEACLAVARRLLGRGPGLTPSGDDVLAGFLIGAAAFDLDAAPIRAAIEELAPARTTALSAALLWHAARGECIDEVAAVAALLTDRGHGSAVSRLLSVGHSSGAALALGLLTAAERALARQEGQAA
jgi:hypothetical protein